MLHSGREGKLTGAVHIAIAGHVLAGRPIEAIDLGGAYKQNPRLRVGDINLLFEK
ncbi:hypothetical protein ES703_48285 [subsurface metagenome]